MSLLPLSRALLSVYHKDGLEPLARQLHASGVEICSTGGTQAFLESKGIPVRAVEDLTGYPSILGGRVKTLHPKVFGGILARREEDHLAELDELSIATFDLVCVDLYPFEETVHAGAPEEAVIEKIDIGGVSLLRAAAKNFRDVVVCATPGARLRLMELLQNQSGMLSLDDRRAFALEAFAVTSRYDTAIFHYFSDSQSVPDQLRLSLDDHRSLRYGENPHQQAAFYGNFQALFHQLAGKELSYNNLLDLDASVGLLGEFRDASPTIAILKHNNACGVATRPSLSQAWAFALEADPASAFGGIIMANRPVDLETARLADRLFFEVLIAPDWDKEALALLSQKKNRILLQQKSWPQKNLQVRSMLNGFAMQELDSFYDTAENCKVVSANQPTSPQWRDMFFAMKVCKHLKSNAITLVRNEQLLGMGCGHTARVDALEHALAKACKAGFTLDGAVMASDAFFPFPDCVEIAAKSGIKAVIHPGGSVRDKDSVDACNAKGMVMVHTGIRHFRH